MCEICDRQRNDWSRRDVLRGGALAAASAVLAGQLGFLRPRRAAAGGEASLAGKGKARQIVLLYMNGGASQFETFDPKPGTASGGPTRTIASNVAGIRVAESLPLLARQMDKICLVRGMTSNEGNHERARYLMHTGYPPTPTVTHAALGSLVAHEKGASDAALPQYVSLNGPGARPGYLGPGFAPLVVQSPGERSDAARPAARSRPDRPPVDNLVPPAGLSPNRRDRRLALLEDLNQAFARTRADDEIPAAQRAMFERARRLMDTPKNTAFDLGQESDSVRERYGPSAFGQACLMARRLLAAGVTFVEVMSNGWDTHADNFTRVKALNAQIDRGISALLEDLGSSGRLEETLIVWMGDFGRTPEITSGDGRGHFPRAWTVWLAGAGVQGGRAVGKTSPDGREVVEDAVTVPDLFASIAYASGMDPEKTFTSNGRPLTIVPSGGRPLPIFQ